MLNIIIIKIIKKFILEENNSTIITKYIENYYNHINRATINKILNWLWYPFSHYLKDIYRLNKLGKTSGGSNISISKKWCLHIYWGKNMGVGAINNKTRNIRIDIFKTRNSSNMKLFIFNNIKKDNNIITDEWPIYSFLDNDDDPYTHKAYVHQPNGQFGFGQYRTSHNEWVWNLLKKKNIFNNLIQ